MAPVGWVFDLDGVIWRGAEPVPRIRGGRSRVARPRRGRPLRHEHVGQPGHERREEACRARHRRDGSGADLRDGRGPPRRARRACARLCRPGGGRGARSTRARSSSMPTPPMRSSSGYHREFDYERLTTAMRAVRAGARLIGSNDDATYPMDDGLFPGNGALLAAVRPRRRPSRSSPASRTGRCASWCGSVRHRRATTSWSATASTPTARSPLRSATDSPSC